MKDSDIDFSDSPELGPDFFANAILWRPREERDEREGDSGRAQGETAAQRRAGSAMQAEGEANMSDVIEMHGPGPCEGEPCQKELRGEDRIIKSADERIRVGEKNYHKGCEPSQEKSASKNRA
jgi:hypothetical protein